MPLPRQFVAAPAELTECLHHLAACPVLGFDTEFIGEETYQPQLCLVQVATPHRLVLIDPIALPDLSGFWALLRDPGRTVVVHAGREEIRMCRYWGGGPPANLFDVQIAAGLLGSAYPAGHAALVSQFLRVQLDKGETLTDWSRRPLTPRQTDYAYDDVRYLLALHEIFARKLGQLDRLDWLTEEGEALIRRALQEDPLIEPWRKLRGLGGLDRKKLAIVRELFAWREQRAVKINKPVRVVLRDDLVIEIAKRNPKTDRDLAVVRGLPRIDLTELLEAVRRGRETPAEGLPDPAERDNDPAQVALVASFLSSVLGGWCAANRLAPGLVATVGDVKSLVRAELTGEPADGPLTRGWRGRHVLPVLRSILEGRVAVRVAGGADDGPFALEPIGGGRP